MKGRERAYSWTFPAIVMSAEVTEPWVASITMLPPSVHVGEQDADPAEKARGTMVPETSNVIALARPCGRI